MGFMKKNIPCTLLSEPVRVRLFREDLDLLNSSEIDIQAFIQRAVNIQVRILKKWK